LEIIHAKTPLSELTVLIVRRLAAFCILSPALSVGWLPEQPSSTSASFQFNLSHLGLIAQGPFAEEFRSRSQPEWSCHSLSRFSGDKFATGLRHCRISAASLQTFLPIFKPRIVAKKCHG
jgi:hypothetical protein